jgi:hypothetical protein
MSVTSSVNESIRKHENKLKLKDLEACVPGVAIIRQGRVGPSVNFAQGSIPLPAASRCC